MSDAINPSTPPSGSGAAQPLWRIAIILVGLTWALELYALWAHPYAPLVDLPNHMARHYLESVQLRGGALPPYYAVEWKLLPNLGGDLVVPVLMLFLSPETACKVFLTLSVLLYWVGPALFLMQCLPSRPQALAASLLLLPWTFTGHFFWGFLNFYSGVGLAFLVLAHHLRLGRRDRVSAAGLLWHAALVALLFVWHLAPWVLYCVVVGCRAAARLLRGPDGFRVRFVRCALALAPAAPSMLLFVIYSLANRGVNPEAGWEWGGLPRKLAGPLGFFAGYDWRADGAVCLLWAAAVVAMFRLPRFGDLKRGWIGLCLAALSALYLLLPWHLGATWDADTRVLPALLVLGLAAVGAAPLRRPRLGAALLAAGLVLRFGSILYAWDGLAARLDAHARSFAALEPHGRVLPVMLLTEHHSKTVPEFHFPAWAVSSRGAYVPTLFAQADQQPLRIRAPYDAPAAVPHGYYGPDGYTIDEAIVRERFDYVWLYNPAGKAIRAPASFERVFADETVTVWRVPPERAALAGDRMR